MMPEFPVETEHVTRVIPVGYVAELRGVRVIVLALEIYETAAVLSWRAAAADRRPRPFGQPAVTVQDDHGQAYHVHVANWSGSEFGIRGEFYVLPCPSPEARLLTVAFQSFSADRRMMIDRNGADLIGPWTLNVNLR